MDKTENWLAIPTVFLSFLSVASCIAVCVMYTMDSIQIYVYDRKNRYQKPAPTDNRKDISLEIIFYSAICDGLWTVELFLNWTRQIDVGGSFGYWTNSECMVLGIYSQFFGALSPLLHVLLAYHLCHLLFGGSLNKLENRRYFHYIVIILLAVIATIIPLFPNNEYGVYKNPDIDDHINDRECWLKSKDYQLIWVGINTFSMFVHYFTLIVALYKWKQTAFLVLSPIYYYICVKMLRFVFCYTLIRLPATMARFVEISTGKSYWSLIIVNHWMQSCIGMGDFIVYLYNRKEKYSRGNHFIEYDKKFLKDSPTTTTFNHERELKDSPKFITPVNGMERVVNVNRSLDNMNMSVTTLSSKGLIQNMNRSLE
eukprot:279481_1